MCRFLTSLPFVLFFGTAWSWTPEEVINRLNGDLRLGLNVYLDCGDQELCFDSGVSNLVLNSLSEQQKLIGRFSERCLIIACLEKPTENRTLDGLKQLLWGLQHLPLLYVGNVSKNLGFFEEALSKGFLRVLTLNLASGKLHSFEPYPKIKVHAINDMNDFYRLTRLRNLQGHRVRLTVETVPPRCFHYQNRQGKEIYAGYMYKLLNGFIRAYNGTEEFVLQDLDPIPIEAYVNALIKDEIDMIPRITMDFKWAFFYRSLVLYNVKTFVIVPWSEPLAKSLYFLRPFAWIVWLTIIASMAYASMWIWWMRNRDQEAYPSLPVAFIDVLQLMVQVPLSRSWHYCLGLHNVVTFLVLFTVGFTLTNLYTAQLSCSLSAGLFKSQINTYDDLFQRKKILLLDPIDAAALMNMTQRGEIQEGFDNIVEVTSQKEVFRHRKQLNTTYIYHAYEDRIEFELFQQKYLRVPIFKKLSEIYTERHFFLALRHGLPYVELFNDYLRRMWESGIFGKLVKDAFSEGIDGGEITFRKSTSREIQIFDTEYYYFAYILLGVGWLSGFIVFLLERWRYYNYIIPNWNFPWLMYFKR